MTILFRLWIAFAAWPAVALAQDVPTVTMDRTGPQLTKLIILLVVFVFILIAMRQVRLPEIAKTVAVWLAILIGLVAIYAYREPLQTAGREVMSVLVPGMAVSHGADQVVVRRAFDGHFMIDGEVDGAPVRFVFDTGASTVVLTAADAARAGFDPARLDYRQPVMTASGMTRVAPVRLETVAVGGLVVNGVRAAVAQPQDLELSLLGMTFLNRLSGYEVRRDRLVLNR